MVDLTMRTLLLASVNTFKERDRLGEDAVPNQPTKFALWIKYF